MKALIVLVSLLSCVIAWNAQASEISGTVLSLRSNLPLEDVIVIAAGWSDTSFMTVTEPSGLYILTVLPDTYAVQFQKAGYCDIVADSVAIEENADTTINAALPDPQFACSVTWMFGMAWYPHQVLHDDFQLSNPDGECPLVFVISDTSDWLSVEPESGTIAADSELTIDVTMVAPDYTEWERQSALQIDHNGANSPYIIPVSVAVLIDHAGTKSPGNIPLDYALASHPNPFNPTTSISFSVPRAGNVELSVFDISGRVIATLASGAYAAGEHSVTFDGAALPSGIYFAHLSAGSIQRTQKLVLLK